MIRAFRRPNSFCGRSRPGRGIRRLRFFPPASKEFPKSNRKEKHHVHH